LLWLPLVTQPATGSIPEDKISDLVEEFIFPMSTAPGMIIGIVSGKDVYLAGFGETARGSGVKPNGETVWQIGIFSITNKPFLCIDSHLKLILRMVLASKRSYH